MKKKSLLAVATLWCAVVLWACGSARQSTSTSTIPTGEAIVADGSIKIGKESAEKFCVGCHELPDPQSKSPRAFERIIPGMVKRHNNKFTSSPISPEIQSAIISFYVATAKN